MRITRVKEHDSEMKTLILVPGLLGDIALWQLMIDNMPSGYKFQVVDVNVGNSIEEIAQNLWTQCDNKDVILIRFSLGAWIALQAYKQKPDCCKGLVLISSAPGYLKSATRQRFQHHLSQIDQGHFEQFIQSDFEHDIAKQNQQDQHIKNLLLTMMRHQGPRVAINQLKWMLQFKGNFDHLSYIKCPTLLLRGSEDKSIDVSRQQAICNEITQSELKIVANASHYVPIENPIITAQVLQNWLERITQ